MARRSKKIDYVNVNDLDRRDDTPLLSAGPSQYRAGLYVRLSEETEANRERETAATQMELLRRFVSEEGDIAAVREYADISCTGTNFERPGFEEMLQDVRNGVIDCIIVKDLSRLGRNYLETGNYIERVFPFFGVRFISVTDGYDSCKDGEGLMMPLKNMVNEMYVKDLSQKMKSAYRAKWSKGEFCSRMVPYGYIKVDRHLEPDPDTRDVVSGIFQMFLQGSSMKEIARQLSQNWANPKTYKLMMEGKEIPENLRAGWNAATIRSILKNEVYIGNIVHNRVSLVAGRLVQNPSEEWVIVEGTHEPLVSRDDFDRVQEILDENVKKFHAVHGKNGFDHARFNLLGRKIRCADCGTAMGFRKEGTRRVKAYYRCKTYLDTAKTGCTDHKVSQEDVNEAVFEVIHRHMQLCVDVGQTAREMQSRDAWMKKKDVYCREADRIRRELKEAVEIKADIFEDYRDGLIDEEQYMDISRKHHAEIHELKVRLGEVEKAWKMYSEDCRTYEEWKATVKKFFHKRKLTQEMVDAFVEKVLVHADGSLEVFLKYDDLLGMMSEIKGEVSYDG